MTGHLGRDTTLEMVQRHYWWPRLCHFVYEYVAGCTTCQQNKINMHPTQLPTQPIKSMVTKPFQMITQDFISGLPKTKKGHDHIMVMVDHGLMKGVIFIPCSKELTALEAAELHSIIRSNDLEYQRSSYLTETLFSSQKPIED